MQNLSVQLLKETIKFQHSLTVWYASLLKDTDPLKSFDLNGAKLNNLYWLIAHLANSEDLLLARALGMPGSKIEWLKKFNLGSSKEEKGNVEYKELIEIYKNIHNSCMANLDKLSDEDLLKENAMNFSFGGDKSMKAVILHHIRHAGMHTGHLSLLCSAHGIKTI